jgi:hypothetical protein
LPLDAIVSPLPTSANLEILFPVVCEAGVDTIHDRTIGCLSKDVGVEQRRLLRKRYTGVMHGVRNALKNTRFIGGYEDGLLIFRWLLPESLVEIKGSAPSAVAKARQSAAQGIAASS